MAEAGGVVGVLDGVVLCGVGVGAVGVVVGCVLRSGGVVVVDSAAVVVPGDLLGLVVVGSAS
ncbi:MAG TPA: hypothetical protein EYP73_08100 [Acidimicrobiia bacterium]|nr:hypothetical protein [Acidimicrobiia bacterium]